MPQRLAGAALRTAIFMFVAAVVVGPTWQLWAGGALFMAPQLLAVYEHRFPKSKSLTNALPDGLLELVLMLFLLLGLGALLLSTNSRSLIANSFVLLALPGVVLAVLHLFGGDDARPRSEWTTRIAGAGLLFAAVLQVRGILF